VTGFGAYWRCTPCGHSWLVPRSAASPSDVEESSLIVAFDEAASLPHTDR
jgi:hypothetical protein